MPSITPYPPLLGIEPYSDAERSLLQMMLNGEITFVNPILPTINAIRNAATALQAQLDRINVITPPVIETPDLPNTGDSASPLDALVPPNPFPQKEEVYNCLEEFKTDSMSFLKRHTDRLSGANLRDITDIRQLFGTNNNPMFGLLISISTSYYTTMYRVYGDTGVDYFSPIFGSILNQEVRNQGVVKKMDSMLQEIIIILQKKASALDHRFADFGEPTISLDVTDPSFVEFFDTTFDGFVEQMEAYNTSIIDRAEADNSAYEIANAFLSVVSVESMITTLYTRDRNGQQFLDIVSGDGTKFQNLLKIVADEKKSPEKI